MFDLLEKIRSRPDSHKKTFSAVASLLVTLVIFGVWITAFSPITRTSEIISQAQSQDGPMKNFNRNLAQSFGVIGDQLNFIKEYFSNESLYQSLNQIEFVPNEPKDSTFATGTLPQKPNN